MARTPLFDSIQTVRNYVINGNFDFWQRGASLTTPASGTYLADRFRVDYDGSGSTFTISRQAFTPGAEVVTGSPVYFHRHQVTVAGSGETTRTLQTRLEGARVLAGKTATLSFWAKADAARTLTASITQSFGTGGSPSSAVTGTGATACALTTSWQKFTIVFAVPSIAGKTLGTNGDDYLGIVLAMPVNTAMTIDIAQVMLNEGHEPASFSRAGRDFEAELALCQRFYEKSYDLGITPGSDSAGTAVVILTPNAGANTGAWTGGHVTFAVRKRTTPIVLAYETTAGTVNQANGLVVNTNGSRTGTPIFSAANGNVGPTTWGFDHSLNTGTSFAGYMFNWTAESEL